MYASTSDQIQTLVITQVTTLLTNLLTWAQTESRTLGAIEQQVLPMLQSLGQTIVAGCAQIQAPATPPSTVTCACGQDARALRQRPATVISLLGRITIPRTYYHCAACGSGQYPLDAQLAICAGSRSAGLNEILALLGSTQDSFAEAASVLERLTLIHLSPTTVRTATEQLGAILVAQQAQQAAQILADDPAPTPDPPSPTRLYIAMDGVFAHIHHRSWREIKVGCCFETQTCPDRTHPGQTVVRAVRLSYLTALTEAAPFGELLWSEAVRRGVLDADEVVVISDGAHWIWNLAQLHFPNATHIVDWYHASQYVWTAATAIWSEDSPVRAAWVTRQLAALWDGKVTAVLKELVLRQSAGAGAGVTEAISYYTTHQGRMDYAAYRARGLQIGSGSIESGCKQLVSARLKQAGMIWSADGAEAVATVTQRVPGMGQEWAVGGSGRPVARAAARLSAPSRSDRSMCRARTRATARAPRWLARRCAGAGSGRGGGRTGRPSVETCVECAAAAPGGRRPERRISGDANRMTTLAHTRAGASLWSSWKDVLYSCVDYLAEPHVGSSVTSHATWALHHAGHQRCGA